MPDEALDRESEPLELEGGLLTDEDRARAAEHMASRSATYFGRHGLVFAWRWSDVLLNGGNQVPRVLLWDLRPLEPGSWENILGFAHERLYAVLKASIRGYDDSGDNIIDMQRWRWRESAFVEYFPEGESPDLEQLTPDGVRRCYIPTWYHVDLILGLFPRRRRVTPASAAEDTLWDALCARRSLTLSQNPCAAPWPLIETELVAAGYDRDKLVSMTAPALIERLADSREARRATHSPTIIKPDAGTAEEPKKRKRPGRKRKSDVKVDKRIYEAWATALYPTYAELEAAMKLPKGEGKRACDRHRKRLPKGK